MQMELINFDADLVTSAQALAVDGIVNEYGVEPLVEVTDGEGKDEQKDNEESKLPITPPTCNNIDEAIETLTNAV